MDLHIVQMFQTDAMLFGNIKRIPGQMWEVRRMLISSADSTTCKDGILRIDLHFFSVLRLR